MNVSHLQIPNSSKENGTPEVVHQSFSSVYRRCPFDIFGIILPQNCCRNQRHNHLPPLTTFFFPHHLIVDTDIADLKGLCNQLKCHIFPPCTALFHPCQICYKSRKEYSMYFSSFLRTIFFFYYIILLKMLNSYGLTVEEAGEKAYNLVHRINIPVKY